jgi:hypothetical protein
MLIVTSPKLVQVPFGVTLSPWLGLSLTPRLQPGESMRSPSGNCFNSLCLVRRSRLKRLVGRSSRLHRANNENGRDRLYSIFR